jgi:hypothetical protein
MTEEVKHSMFEAFWNNLYEQTENRRYCPILASSDYDLLAIWSTTAEYYEWMQLTAYYAYIPLWDYADGIKEFMDTYIQCAIDENMDEILESIMKMKTTKSVISYIETIRMKEERNIAKMDIEEQYRSFLQDLIYVWAELNGCSFG